MNTSRSIQSLYDSYRMEMIQREIAKELEDICSISSTPQEPRRSTVNTKMQDDRQGSFRMSRSVNREPRGHVRREHASTPRRSVSISSDFEASRKSVLSPRGKSVSSLAQ
mmetsp:Transcript_21040/g.36192  ORF Transcript_21040/g.36192 Transcript_21040/m.36192 type:complete len:110 (+) Transcript_21040:139-468(+)